MAMNYQEQKSVLNRKEEERVRDYKVTQLQACLRHYGEVIAAIDRLPIDPSSDAIMVRVDVATMIGDRITSCENKIAELKAT